MSAACPAKPSNPQHQPKKIEPVTITRFMFSGIARAKKLLQAQPDNVLFLSRNH